MNTNGPLLLYYLVIVSLTLNTILCLGAEDQTIVDDVSSPFSTEEEANSFLDSRSRKKRTLWEECYGEGCSFWEAAYYYGNWDSTREYLYEMACNKWPCETGCRCERAHPGYRDSGPHWRVCNACTAIANCEQLICTTASNHQCNRCNFDRGGQIKAYQQVSSGGYPNRVCEQRCSWRPDSKFCYPGRCPGTPSTCTCAPGFGGNNCLTISSQPTIMHCLAKLQRVVNGAERDTLEADCGAVTAPSTVYVGRHIAYNRLQITWYSSWNGPIASRWPRPYYINDFKVGIVTASSTWRLLRGGSALRSGTITCDIGHNRDNPDTNLHDCVDHGDLVLPTLQHGDKLEFKARATNGGYVVINNYDRSDGHVTQNPRQYYQGSEVVHTAHFTYDLRAPVHCSVASSCSSKIMEIGPPYTKNGKIQLRWTGWSDEDSGLGRYEYVVYKLQPYGDVLGMRSVTRVMSGSQNVSGGAVMVEVTLSDPGTYCFLLTVYDVAGNYQRARRFLIYDDVNNVTVDAHQPLWADSAAANTSHLWQTNLQDSLGRGAKVSLKWPGRYRNLFHHQHKLLAAIEPHDPPIAAGYEAVTGLPPLQRSRQAIPNAHGIIIAESAFAVDHAGGRNIMTPPNTWTTVPDVTAEGVDLDIPRADGDSVRLWLQAYDVMGNFVQEDVLLHVDSSPPVVQNVWLKKHGVTALIGNHSSNLFTIRFGFEAFDDHSGLHNIHWQLKDFLNSSTVHGEGQVAIMRPSVLHPECDPPHCACIPKDSKCFFRNYEIVPDLSKMDIPLGSHDHDYVIVITVTNNAKLVTTVTFQPVCSDGLYVDEFLFCETVYNNKCYRQSKDALSHKNASTACVSLGGQLADVKGPSDQGMLASIIQQSSNASYWTIIKSQLPHFFHGDGFPFSVQSPWMARDIYSPFDICVLLDRDQNYEGDYHACTEQHNYVCESPVTSCQPNVCQNGGKCSSCFVGSHVCDCPPGYTGLLCETDINECESNPCQNGGTCLDRLNSFSCVCRLGYAGDLCENDVNYCDPNPCPAGFTCVDKVLGFGCEVTVGVRATSAFCKTSPCGFGWTCVEAGTTGYSCILKLH